ncbi:MAG: efflux RND transporter permease subunit [Chloroflexi bacterium]|nr:efflux RND transporter permease subunit [Chloroflexota bacterium]
MNIPKLSINSPVFITMIMVALVVVGLLSFTRLPVDLLPNISIPVVAISTVYPGASASDVERSITKPIEEAVSALNGVDTVTATSQENLSVVIIEFTLESDAQKAAQDVQEKINAIRGTFPRDALSPTVQRFDLGAMAILALGVTDTSGKMSPEELRRFVDEKIKARLERIDGVAQVGVTGGLQRQIQVQLNLDALRARRIAPSQVTGAIAQANASLTGGRLQDNGQEVLLRTPGDFHSLEEIRNVVITTPRGVPVYVRDVATVQDGYADVDTYSRLNGGDSIGISVQKQSGTNTVAVADNVKSEIAKLQKEYPDVNIVVASDQSEFIKTSVEDSLTDLILGGIFAALVVLFFFRDLRNTLVTVIGLPVIMIATFAAMAFLNMSLNLVTLLALSLAVGLVIDDAIVVRENIFRHMERGQDPKTASLNGTNEVALSVLAMTLTVVSVFLPIAFVSGLIGRIFNQFGLTVTAAVLISLFEAFTLAPMLSAYWFKQRQAKATLEHVKTESQQLDQETAASLGWLDRLYRRTLGWTLAHKWLTAGIAALILVGILACIPLLQFSFLPNTGQDTLSIEISLPPGTPLNTTDAQAREVERVLRELPAVEAVFVTVGGASTPERARFIAKFQDAAAVARAETELRTKLAAVPGLAFGANTMGGGGTGVTGRTIQMNLQTNGSPEDLIVASEQIMNAIRDVPGVVDLGRSYQAGKPELHIDVNREKAARVGLSTAAVGATVRTLVNGDTASRYRDPGREADIVVRLRPEDRARLQDILDLSLLTTTGQVVPLRNIATLSNASGPTALERLNREPKITIGANVIGRAQQTVANDIQARINQLKLPPGVTVKFSGTIEQLNTSFESLLVSLLLSVVFVYMVLASQFGSFTQPLVMMLALPLSLLGAFLALILTGIAFDMTAMIGIIMLFGLVTKNSILLVDFANKLRRDGMPRDQALLTAGPIRLRPVLMTSLSLILGSLPVALGLGAGGSFRQPLALVVIGGLITSTALTLLLVPIAYAILDSVQARFRRQPQKEAAQTAAAPAGE